MLTESPQPQRRSKVPQIAVFVLLVAALPFVYFPQIELPLWGQAVIDQPNDLLYTADLDFWQRSNRETRVNAVAHFDLAHDLNNIPLAVGDWSGVDVPETNQEVMILLEPEQYIQRLYQNSAGQYIWLSLIGGRSSQPFHAPDICYDADGWHYNLGSQAMALADGGEVYGLWLEANKRQPGAEVDTEHIVFYFYLFPSPERRLSDGIVLFKLTSPRYGNVQETLAIHNDFIQQFFTHGEKRNG
jgi:Protein of unknown function (DUF3485)